MNNLRAEKLFFNGGDTLGEGPYWDADRSLLYWFDIMDNELHCMNEHGAAHSVVRTEQKVHAIAIQSGTRALCTAHKHGLAWLDMESGALEGVLNPEPHLPLNLLNDGRCDRAGRFWFASINKRHEPSGCLYSFSNDVGLSAHGSGLRASNGIAISPNDETLYIADTYAGIYAFDFDLSAGSVKNQRMLFEANGKTVLPDGLTIDEDGCVWVAMALAGEIIRITPEGRVDQRIQVPSTFVTSCTFGGAMLDTLFITSARSHRPESELASEPHAGGVFVCRPGVKGLREVPFGARKV